MASLQDLKNRLSFKKDETSPEVKKEIKTLDKPPISDNEKTPSVDLEVGEARYLLALIARSEFSGKDVQIVYDSALKLQEIIKSNLE